MKAFGEIDVDDCSRWAISGSPAGDFLAGAHKLLTARGKQLRQYREHDELKTANEDQRIIAAGVLLVAFIEFHHAKRLIKKKKITTEWQFKNKLNDDQREIVLAGKEAWEWFINPPHKYVSKKKWTLERVCETLKLNIDEIRRTYLKPSAWREYCREERIVSKANLGYSEWAFDRRFAA